MAKRLNVAPTKSNQLVLGDQLEFARNGYDLLEQKRQVLVFEMMSRLGRAKDIERRVNEALVPAFEALRQATLDIGTAALDGATLAVKMKHTLVIDDQSVMGIPLPKTVLRAEEESAQFGVGGTSAQTDVARRRFIAALPLLAQLAELEYAVLRLARELRKTQRRCNALSRIFIPDYAATIAYIESSLEERERESFVILRMIKQRLSPENNQEEVAHA